MKITRATSIGLISGLIMVAISLGIYIIAGDFDNNWQYLTYCTYVASIVYSQQLLFNRDGSNLRFKNYFSEGFRVFVVVTLIMVISTWVFLKTNTQIEDAMAVKMREELLQKGDRTLNQIDKEVEAARRMYITALTSASIFGYLMIGALASVVGGLIFSSKKKIIKQSFNQ